MKRFILSLLAVAGALILAGTASAHGRVADFRQGFHGHGAYGHRQTFVVQPLYTAPLYVQPLYYATPPPAVYAPSAVLVTPPCPQGLYSTLTTEQSATLAVVTGHVQGLGYVQPLTSYQSLHSFAFTGHFDRLPVPVRARVFQHFPRLKAFVDGHRRARVR